MWARLGRAVVGVGMAIGQVPRCRQHQRSNRQEQGAPLGKSPAAAKPLAPTMTATSGPMQDRDAARTERRLPPKAHFSLSIRSLGPLENLVEPAFKQLHVPGVGDRIKND